MYKIVLKLAIVLILSINLSKCLNLEEKSSDELKSLLLEEKYALVLFMKNAECSGDCLVKEKVLLNIREEIAEAIGAWVIRSHAPTILSSWGGDVDVDFLVFVRNGKPLFYRGSLADEDEVLTYFLSNKESSVRNLSDDTFEHETQASSGATTGDWLVVFTKDDCDECDRLVGHIETAAASLKGRKNVAIIQRDMDAGVTTRRFEVTSFPNVILFRLGNLYRYPLSTFTSDSLKSFADDGFRNSKAENIPKPKTPFDDVTQAIADWLRENPLQFVGGVVGVFFVILLLVLLNSPPPPSWTKQNKKKKKQ